MAYSGCLRIALLMSSGMTAGDKSSEGDFMIACRARTMTAGLSDDRSFTSASLPDRDQAVQQIVKTRFAHLADGIDKHQSQLVPP